MGTVLEARLKVASGAVVRAERAGRKGLTSPPFYVPCTVLGALQASSAFNIHSIGGWLRPDSGLKGLGFESCSIT